MKTVWNFETDAHIGSGLSDGIVDADFVKEADGRASAPASAVKGVMEDASIALLQFTGQQVCDPSEQDAADCDCLRCLVYGRAPSRSGMVRIPRLLQQADGKAKGVRTGHTRIDQQTGTAANKTLHLKGHAAAGLVLEGEFEDLGLPAGRRMQALALLRLSLALLDGIGGGRRRGKGQLRALPAEWNGKTGDQIKAHVEKDLAALTAEHEAEEAAVQAAAIRAAHGLPCRLDLEFVLTEPMALPDGPPVGNHFGCLDAVPAAAVAGMFIAAMKRQGADSSDVAALLRSDRIKFPPLLQNEAGTGSLAVPWPLAVESCRKARGQTHFTKDGQQVPHVVRSGLGQAPSLCGCGASLGAAAGKNLVISRDGGFGVHLLSSRRMELHNSIQRSRQSVLNEGGIFSQEIIPAGTRFTGSVLFQDEAARVFFISVLRHGEGPVRVSFGKAKSKMGRGELRWAESAETALPALRWRAAAGADTHFSLTLLSHTVVLDDDLVLRAAPSAEDLRIAAGNEKPFCCEAGNAEIFSRSVVVSGFNAFKGLPELPEAVLCPGSTFRYRWLDDVTKDQKEAIFERLERNGVGESRCLGWGRVAVNVLPAADEKLHSLLAPAGAAESVWPSAVEMDGQSAWGAAWEFARQNEALLGEIPNHRAVERIAASGDFSAALTQESVMKNRQADRWITVVCVPAGKEEPKYMTFAAFLTEFQRKHKPAGLKQLAQALRHRQPTTA